MDAEELGSNRWSLMLGGCLLLMALAAGCSGKSQPTESSPPPTQAAPTQPAETAPSMVELPVKSATRAKVAPRMRPLPSPKMSPLPEAKPDKILYYKAAPEEEGAVVEKSQQKQDPRYTVVKVYYATDRSPLNVFQWRQSLRGGWPLATGVCAVFTALLMLWGWRRKRWVVRGLAWTSLIVTVILAGLTLVCRLQPEAANEGIERMYGGDRGELELGTCEVSVPKDHQVGTLESPSVLRLEFRQDPERHVVLLGVHPEPAHEFYADLRKCIERSARKEAFVFIHGYNVGFEKAVRRTAQIAYDLKFSGAPIIYSWPSREGLLSYTVDETNVAWTVPHLKDFLLGVARQSGAASVHLIAHSMGNRALTSALRELALEHKAKCPRFHEVVLTAPDIDADVFRRDLAPAIVGTADRVTLYASSNDEALIASRAVHGYRRAGESGTAMVIVPGVDTVDVSEVDTSLIGHSYYGSNTTVLADLFELMQSSKPPDQRKWLRSKWLGAMRYWQFLREQVSSPKPPSGEEL